MRVVLAGGTEIVKGYRTARWDRNRYRPVPRSVPLEIWISPRSTPGTTRTPLRNSGRVMWQSVGP